MLDPTKVMPLVLIDVRSEHFAIEEHRTVFDACKKLYNENKSIDAVSVLSVVGSEYKGIVVQAAESVPSLKNIKAYLELMQEAYKRQEVKNKASEVFILIEENAEIEEISKATSELQEVLVAENTVHESNAVDGYIDFIERGNQPREYIQTGLYKLNQFAYISYGDYIVVGGRPSAGKTAFTLQMMLKMAERETVVYFSLETSKEKIFDRLISNFCEIPFSDIKSGHLDPHCSIINERFRQFKELNLHVVEASGWTVEQIRSKAMQLKATVIMIDYLSLIQGQGKTAYEKVSKVSIDLHTMAQRTKITVVALSQLNRDGDKTPDMTSLRESGQIEQDADCILLLENLDAKKPNSDRELIIAKNKDGKTGKMTLTFKGELQKFYCREDRY